MITLIKTIFTLFATILAAVDDKSDRIGKKASLIPPDFTIFDIQGAYPDDVTLDEFAEGIVESVVSLSSRVPDVINIRFSRASIQANSGSPFALFTLAGAVHFAQVAIAQTPDTRDWILFNIVIELLDAVIRNPRTPLERRINNIYNEFNRDMRATFGNMRTGILSFEQVVVFIQLDTISVTHRRHAMLKLVSFLNSSKQILEDRSLGGFDKVQRILISRESITQVLDSVKKVLINPPITTQPETTSVSGSRKRWNFFNWYRIL